MSTSKQSAAGAAAGAGVAAARGAAGHAAHPEGLAHLIKMANDISHFFMAEERREDAVAGVANHIRKFWTPKMREKVLRYLAGPADAGMPALEPLSLEAFAHISEKPETRHALSPGGDPGGDAG